ncbi:Vacuolar protein sorting-associated protein 52 [Datura stramonium]|uniref:Vacuolar protein sorting-associated protein 52 n=1 Tax=Datura stramonium TaxID=4076 RepID=A0ABS8VJV5_DATST|nr:Vacuolar protein sorting-associated protein 52 [Datura stramonium]
MSTKVKICVTGVETRSTGLFSRGREPLKNRSAVFALGERINILKEIDEPPLIPHIAEASSKKYPYEVPFLVMSFGEEAMFYDIFTAPFSVIDEHFGTILPNSFDAIGILLMIRIIHQHQVYPKLVHSGISLFQYSENLASTKIL